MAGPDKHSRFSPSAAGRWVRCPGSIQLCEQVAKPREESSHQREGIDAHRLCEALLKGEAPPLVHGYDSEWHEACLQYVAWVKDLQAQVPRSRLEVEKRVRFDDVASGGFGTADAVVSSQSEVHVVDLKFGKGVMVRAEMNWQLMLYAWGALKDRKAASRIVLHIVQPRIGWMDSWRLSRRDLAFYIELAGESARKAEVGEGMLVPGEEQCRWCEARPACPALAARAEEAANASADSLSAERMGQLQELKPAVMAFYKSLDERMLELALRGEMPGWKAVAGRSMRRWTEDGKEQLPELLGAKAWKQSLIGIGEAEKLLSGEIVAELCEKAPGNPALAREDDKRQAWEEHSGFEVLPGDGQEAAG